MSIEENKAVVRRLFEQAVGKGNLEVVEELVTADYVDHMPWPGFPPNRDGLRQGMAQTVSALEDLKLEIKDMIGEGDKVAALITVTGTHTGELAGVPPSGKLVSITSISLYRVADGKVVESWDSNNFS